MTYTQTIKTLLEQEDNHWAIGEALNIEVRRNNDWRGLDHALGQAGLDYKISTLRAYRRVAAAFPQGERVPGVSFAAHQAALTVGTHEVPRVVIERAIRANGKATRDAVLNEVRQIKGRARVDTANAVAAWRDLRRGVEALLALDEAELEALMQVAQGTQAGQAPALVRDLTKAGTKIGKALTKAEAQAKRAAAKAAHGPKAAAVPSVPKTRVTQAAAPAAKKPKVGRLGEGRGEG